MFGYKQLLNCIFASDDGGGRYLVFNQNENTWILPADKLKLAIEMCQPYSKKDQKRRDLILTVKDVGFALRKMGVETVNLLLQPQLKEYIDGLVGTENYYVAAYMGDISSELNQKVTLQIFTNEKILCYLRISNSSEVINVMKHEIDMIDFLHEKEVANIPEIIDASIIGDLHIFAQKSEKKL